MNLQQNGVNKTSSKSILLVIVTILLSLSISGCGADYGEVMYYVGENELYYTSNVTKAEAEELGDYLEENGFFSDGDRISIQLDKEGTSYLFRIVIKKGLENDEETIEIMKLISAELSQNVFNNESVDIHLCDEYFETLRTVVSY